MKHLCEVRINLFWIIRRVVKLLMSVQLGSFVKFSKVDRRTKSLACLVCMEVVFYISYRIAL